MMGAQVARLPDGRMHLHHGPIDLILDAVGPGRNAAFDQARDTFAGLLDGLVGELEGIRSPTTPRQRFANPVARMMLDAVLPHLPCFVTPMAAVAGAVADHVLSAMTFGTRLTKAYVNNGGDIAFHVEGDAVFRSALPQSGAVIEVGADTPWRGLATSGWGGRSHSLGIADAVTVLAATAADADVAATLTANAVDLPGHPAIRRERARDIAPDSDLGDRLVTMEVGPLAAGDVAAALDRGTAYADRLRQRRLIAAAALTLKGMTRTTGPLTLTEDGRP